MVTEALHQVHYVYFPTKLMQIPGMHKKSNADKKMKAQQVTMSKTYKPND